MIEDQQRPRHWMITLFLACCVTFIAIVLTLVLPQFAADLDRNTVLGFPLGFYIVAQGIILIIVAAIAWLGGRQGEIDEKFGGTEDS